MRRRTHYIPITTVKPGQQFIHYGIMYVRADEKEERRHPARELAARRGRPLVFAYSMGDERTPVSFVTDLRVAVEEVRR